MDRLILTTDDLIRELENTLKMIGKDYPDPWPLWTSVREALDEITKFREGLS